MRPIRSRRGFAIDATRVRWVSWVLGLLAMLAVLGRAPLARADDGCGAAASAWVARCAQTTGLDLVLARCPPGSMIVRIGSGAAIDVEIGVGRPNAFQRVGEVGLSPIGEFADWSQESPERRRGLEGLVACVRAHPEVPVPVSTTVPERRTNNVVAGGVRLPWLSIVAAVSACAACAVRMRAVRRTRARDWRAALVIAGGAAAVLAIRWLVGPKAFFHQNGHGATWVGYALRTDAEPSTYGPGYAELFSLPAVLGAAQPERGIFFTQALLGATIAPLAWIVARRVGAPRSVALVLALAIAADPLALRLFQSESYFAACATLAFAAAAVLANGALRGRPRSPAFLLSVLAAGCFVAQAARVHPLAWIPLALLPVVVVVGPGGARRRAALALTASLGIAVVVAVTSGSVLLGVVRGSLGGQWMPEARPALQALGGVVVAASLAGVVAARFAPRWSRAIVIAVLGAIAVVAIWKTGDVLDGPNPAVSAAYVRVFAPVLVALTAAALARAARPRARERIAALALAAVVIVVTVTRSSTWTALPTDAEEARWAMAWRRDLPPGSVVAYVGRAGKRVLTLPLYGGVTGVEGLPLDLDAQDPLSMRRPGYYYRSSVCASEATRARCDELERGLGRLEPIEARDLPARPSMRWHPYDGEVVHVALYRLR